MSTDSRARVRKMAGEHLLRAITRITGRAKVHYDDLSAIVVELENDPEAARREERAHSVQALLDYATMTGEPRIREAADWLAGLPLSGGVSGDKAGAPAVPGVQRVSTEP